MVFSAFASVWETRMPPRASRIGRLQAPRPVSSRPSRRESSRPCIDDARHRDAVGAVVRNLLENRGSRARAIDRERRVPGRVNEREHVAAEPARIGHHDAEHRLGGDGCIGSGAACDQHFLTCGHRQRMGRGHRAQPPPQDRPNARRERLRYQ